ncbi:peptidase S1 family protein [Rhodococcus sp. WMMA185]|uniref:peptidase S1 family protein n=1 Tax=Rhodococcus sp. WMMA185 TaxID=679318 RepID=UPI000878CB81|nr:peptidase S1 family protein [Rhodococcus sp. WMMA185]AOW91670.1 peptidase S1 family protein [Rhodococcus sp. WMMA185]
MLKRFAAVVAVTAGILGFVAVGSSAAAPAAVMGGGSGIVVDDELLCSLTTIGHDNAGRLVGLTAGHCGEVGAQVVPEASPESGVVGRFVVSNHNLDYAVIEFDPAKVTPVDSIGRVTITGIGAPASFPQIACKQGRTTGNTCGVVYGDLLQTHETWTQACVIEGDSGAPMVVGTTLVAMVNAYLAAPCIGPEIGTTMSAVIADMNANGGPGAGFQPI